jgi:hypothetical protein
VEDLLVDEGHSGRDTASHSEVVSKYLSMRRWQVDVEAEHVLAAMPVLQRQLNGSC